MINLDNKLNDAAVDPRVNNQIPLDNIQVKYPAEEFLSPTIGPAGLHEPKKEVSNFDIQRKRISSKLSPIAYAVSSAYHVLSGLGMAIGLVDSDSAFVKNATRFTKTINSLIYGDLAIDAWKGGHTFDFISKILEPTLNCFSQLSNYHLLRGLGSAMTQLHLVNLPHIDPGKGHWENFISNLQETKKFFVESWTSSLLGPTRKLFKGSKDGGHTLALLSHIQGLSGMLGLLNGSRRNLIDKIVGTTRNAVGVGVDIDLLFKKDVDERRTGQYYFAHAIFDTVKRFVTKEHADVIDNLIMPLYNGGMYHFGKITRKQSDGTYVKTVDTTKKAPANYLHQPRNEYSIAA